MQTFSDTQLRELARKRIAFRAHLISYCVIISVLWGIWYVTGPGYLWPIWPTAIWGIGLILHYIFDYRFSELLSEEEEYQRLKTEIETKEHKGNN
jgi:2TM domain